MKKKRQMLQEFLKPSEGAAYVDQKLSSKRKIEPATQGTRVSYSLPWKDQHELLQTQFPSRSDTQPPF